MKYPNVYVKLVGEDGNAFSILARVSKALKKAGVSKEEISKFQKDVKQQHTFSQAKLILSYQNKRR
ncbi:hypothetical protein DYM56_00595 [Campylobacter jejuni]|nr:hypothetical protein [Campylobacter jejuni]EAH6067645.1 hypothetical protein [Campylobacter jejuni]EAH6719517.1 hypothetical protein [Campylobacter jejuni]EAH6807018.1 hypothetical protein [Campylobacter jejuni]EAH7834305.1 hypothetical protein [Campylobacter jejuni]